MTTFQPWTVKDCWPAGVDVMECPVAFRVGRARSGRLLDGRAWDQVSDTKGGA